MSGIPIPFPYNSIPFALRNLSPESEFVAYRFKVVPFGAKSSPFILNSVVIHHLNQEHSPIAKDMRNNIFVDNGCDSTEAARTYYTTANEIMERAGLPLQAWGFSDVSIEQQFKSEGRLDQNHVSKTRGFSWNRVEDTLNIKKVNLTSFCSETVSHRDVLRGVATLYDPLGFYAPLITKGRILLQDLHKEKVKLDETLSTKHREQWIDIANSITEAVDQQIMRLTSSLILVLTSSQSTTFTIFTFLSMLVVAHMERLHIWSTKTR